ncbi:YheV family putative zinc ribbon protein [Motiliproteus sp. SC1-56]|uniref:YheV family putative zinc ribbon protein n=1 Tax=Motiliproteus sp. SC1-56 TaxID=2799565 RepID=UPI001A8C86F4|nr:YheV family putative zinc ribbon protein [Motiliproteus sp. SC1-56]
MSSITKRFIAGAVCPRCAAMDKLRTYRDAIHEHRECVACGYEDSMRLDGAPSPREMETRVNSPRPAASSGEQVLQFVPNPKLGAKARKES